MSSYPPPSHALMVWLEPSGLCVQIPHATDPQGPSHILRLGPSADDYAKLLNVLRCRRDVPGAERTIGTPSAPTQTQLEVLANVLVTAAKAERAAERAEKARQSAKVNATPDALADFLLEDDL
jgi:hypothetical protein